MQQQYFTTADQTDAGAFAIKDVRLLHYYRALITLSGKYWDASGRLPVYTANSAAIKRIIMHLVDFI
jgi:hypothetical protein